MTSRISKSHQHMSAAVFALIAAGTLCSSSCLAQSNNSAVVNPYSPAVDHHYRHGVVPTREQHAKMQAWRKANNTMAITAATGPQTLTYGGGVDGIGVTSGTPKVYLVVYGTQWGTAGTDASGNMTLSGDAKGAVPYLQNMFKRMGTGGELWSGVMTQYCDGPLVANGATTCPSGAPHVGYPTGGAFAGIWYDNSAASPASATGAQLAQEAVRAAAHFGNTTAASNRYAQYVVLSPSGTTPDGFNTPSGGFCAWHDWNGDVGVSSPYGDIAFTNMPYVTDAGSSCGQGFVNGSAGTLDGFSMVEGHEYAETITDQNPAGGWTNHTGGTYNGQENADECAWISSGQGASQNVSMGGVNFAMQSTWSNDTNRCDISHPIVGGPGPLAVSGPSNLTVSAGGTATFSVTASGGTGPYSYQWYRGTSAIAGATSATYSFVAQSTDNGATFKAIVTDSATPTRATVTSATATLTVSTVGPMVERMVNGGFESGTSPWTGNTNEIGSFSGESAYAGTRFCWLDGYGTTHNESIVQAVAIPASSTKATLSFALHIDSAETTTSVAYDKLTVTLKNSSGTVLKTLATFSNLDKASGYKLYSYDVSAYVGTTVYVTFNGTEDSSLQTSFVLDNVSLQSN